MNSNLIQTGIRRNRKRHNLKKEIFILNEIKCAGSRLQLTSKLFDLLLFTNLNMEEYFLE